MVELATPINTSQWVERVVKRRTHPEHISERDDLQNCYMVVPDCGRCSPETTHSE